jgi:hypothetical protein
VDEVRRRAALVARIDMESEMDQASLGKLGFPRAMFRVNRTPNVVTG